MPDADDAVQETADSPRAKLGHFTRPSLTPLLPTSNAPRKQIDDESYLEAVQGSAFIQRAKEVIERNAGFGYVCCSALCLCLVNVIVAVFYSNSETQIPACQVIFVRMFITGLCTVAYAKWIGMEHALLGPPGVRMLLVVRGVVGFFGLGSVYYSLAYLSVSDVTTLTFLSPPATGLAAVFLLNEAYRPIEALAALSSLLGVVFIAKPSTLFASSDDPNSIIMYDGRPVTEEERIRAVLVCLVGVLGATGAYLSIRKIGTRASPLHSIAYFSYYCCIVSSVLMVIFPSQRPVMPSGWGFAALMLSIGLLGFCAQAALTTGLQKEKAGRATVANYIQMPAAMTLEFLIFKRLPDLLSTIGATVILSSALIVVLSKQPKNTVPTVPGVEDLHEEDGQVELSPSRPTSQYLPVKTEDEV